MHHPIWQFLQFMTNTIKIKLNPDFNVAKHNRCHLQSPQQHSRYMICLSPEVDSQMFKTVQNSQKQCILYKEKKPPIRTPVLSLQQVSLFLWQQVPLQFHLMYGLSA